jgi:hypothetical protein
VTEEQVAPEPATAAPGPAGPRALARDAWRMVTRHPRQSILPLLVIEAPVAAVVSAVATAFFLTTFKDEPFRASLALVTGDDARGVIFLLAVVAAVQALFTQVAHGAMVVSVAGVLSGKPKSLTESLDVAFSRMGSLLILALLIMAGAIVLVGSIVFIPLALFLALRLAVNFEVMLLERTGPRQAFVRSWVLMRGHMLRFLGALLLTALIAVIPFVAISSLAAIEPGSRTVSIVVVGVLAVVQAALMTPVIALLSSLTTIYYFTLGGNTDARRPS